MSNEQGIIEGLPEETRSKLRSTQLLTSLPQIVSELLQNSLDANASHVDIGINFKEWMCWVKDDGEGISKEALEKLGQGHDGRYYTSKSYAPGSMNSTSTFGFRGEALASAADVSCLEICSRTAKSRNTWSLIVKGNQQLYLGSAVRWTRESPGTTVCVRDAFFNLPIRRRSHPNPSRTWELVRHEMERYALMFPHVSFTLEDTSRPAEDSHLKERVVRIPKCPSTLYTFRHLFGRAMADHVEEIDFISDPIKITGFISLTGAASKAYQFLYINRHPVSILEFSRAIDSEFASSSFGITAIDEGEKNLSRSTLRRSPRKNEKKPIYVFNISVAPAEVDNCLEPSKNSVQLGNQTAALSCLRTVIRTFLGKHNFLRERDDLLDRSTRVSSPAHPAKGRKSDYISVDDSGYSEAVPLAGLSGFSIEEEPITTSAELFASMDVSAEEIVWQDTATRERFVVDLRTGHSFPQTRYHAHSETVDFGIDYAEGRRTLQTLGNNVRSVKNADSNISSIPEWLERALQSNDVYAISEDRMLPVNSPLALNYSASSHGPRHQYQNGSHKPQNTSPFEDSAFNDTYSEFVNYGFVREDLRDVEIINQVDCKFIACRIPRRDSHLADAFWPEGILVLVDQHAADERIRVERFLKELCLGFLHSQNGTNDICMAVRVKQLVPPRPVLLAQRDTLTVMQSQAVRDFFSNWGVQMTIPPNNVPVSDHPADSGSSGYSQLLVNTIPEIVSEKLVQGDELRDFIQGILGQIQNGELSPDSRLDFHPEIGGNEFVWLKAVRYCPRGLLDLVNSKACRGVQ